MEISEYLEKRGVNPKMLIDCCGEKLTLNQLMEEFLHPQKIDGEFPFYGNNELIDKCVEYFGLSKKEAFARDRHKDIKEIRQIIQTILYMCSGEFTDYMTLSKMAFLNCIL